MEGDNSVAVAAASIFWQKNTVALRIKEFGVGLDILFRVLCK